MIKKAGLIKLASLLILFSLLLTTVPVKAFAVTQFELEEIQQKTNAITLQREQSQAKIKELEAKQASALAKKAAIDERNEHITGQIAFIKEKIQLYDEILLQKKKEADAAKEKETQHLEKIRLRIKAFEAKGKIRLLDILRSAGSFREILAALGGLDKLWKNDHQLLLEHAYERENAEQAKNDYEKLRQELVQEMQELENEQASLPKQFEDVCALISDTEEELGKAGSYHEEYVKAEENAKAQLEEMTRQFEQLMEEGKTDNPGFIWPVPSCKVITSRYGSRVHPISNQERAHAGLDIGARAGVKIVAAYKGKVELAKYSGSYGNYVVIDHGNGYSTLYAHMSSMEVKSGQELKQGDIIGYVGSTGYSTGPHLHFEIRYKGSTIDPASYFDDLTYRNG